MTSEGSVAPRERVHITCGIASGDPATDEELPFRILVVGDFTSRPDPRAVEERAPFKVDKDTFDRVLEAQKLELELVVPDKLSKEHGVGLCLRLEFARMKDFSPEGVARQVPEMRRLLELRASFNAIKAPLGPTPLFGKALQPLLADEAGRQRLRRELGLDGPPPPAGTSLFDELLGAFHMKPEVEGYDVCKRGLEAVVAAMMTPRFAGERLDKNLADALIADLDERLSAQVNEVMHHPSFRALEAAWRTLKLVVDRVDFRENVRVDVLPCSKSDLRLDFEDSPDVSRSGLYKHVCEATYRTSEGVPYGLVVADFEFGPAPGDVWLLARCAAVSAAAHAPFLAGASPAMVGASSWEASTGPENLRDLFEARGYARWQDFRASDDARYVGLCLPRFMLRLPYGSNTVPVKAFNFEEDAAGHPERYLWGNAAALLAVRAADSFARYRWAPNIILPAGGGLVGGLPLYQYELDGEIRCRSPLEARLTERRAYELSQEGLIGLRLCGDGDQDACFFSAHSCWRPALRDRGPEGVTAETDASLDGQLPYLFVVARLAHNLKVLYRQHVARGADALEPQRLLQAWLSRYVAPVDAPAPGDYPRRPLYEASVTVEALRESPGAHRFELRVRPHFKHRGASFVLSLVGRLDA